MHVKLISKEKMPLNENQKSESEKETFVKVLDSFITHFSIIKWVALACSFQTLGAQLYKKGKWAHLPLMSLKCYKEFIERQF